MRFNELNLNKDILDAIKKAGYEEATPIQEKSIPVMLAGRDMIGLAQTGTGKTAAFALPILEMLEPRRKNQIRALVLSPTRELAIQTFENFKKYGRYRKLRTVCLYGGAKKGNQINALYRGCDILVATPGRLIDLANEGHFTLDHIQILVLDEADRMLDMGFLPDMKRITAMIPETRQTVMFSATMEKKVEALAREMLTDPERIQVAAQNNAADTVEQRLIFTEREMKDEVIINLLQEQLEKDDENALSRKDRTNAIVFTRTKRGAERLNRVLNHAGIGAAAIHGDKTQGQRKDALDRFRAGRTQVLVATDVAARGIDVPSLSYVFNYDLPEEAENYVHRIGRTGRAGEEGIAITLCDKEELELLEAIEYLIKKEIPVVETEWSIHLERIPHRGQGANHNRGYHSRNGQNRGGRGNGDRRRYRKPGGQNGQNGSRENRQSSQRRNHYRSNGGQNKGYRKPRHMSHREKTRHMSENKSASES